MDLHRRGGLPRFQVKCLRVVTSRLLDRSMGCPVRYPLPIQGCLIKRRSRLLMVIRGFPVSPLALRPAILPLHSRVIPDNRRGYSMLPGLRECLECRQVPLPCKEEALSEALGGGVARRALPGLATLS